MPNVQSSIGLIALGFSIGQEWLERNAEPTAVQGKAVNDRRPMPRGGGGERPPVLHPLPRMGTLACRGEAP